MTFSFAYGIREVTIDGPAAFRSLKLALQAYEIQPDSTFVLYNLGYALLMDGREEDGDRVFLALASLGEGAVQTVRLDFAAMEKAGIYSPHMPEVLAMMEEAAG